MTNKNSRHDFQEFMDLIKIQLSAGYFNISKRTKEDPGTAGDQAEEDWASFLRDWLPATYQIVTKGRIINSEGKASPQIDILVLHPNYPKKLITQKHYFSGGVVAAFECKLNARPGDIKKAFENAAIIKQLVSPSVGNPFDELYHSPFYGLLAHTTTIKDHINDGVYGVINKHRTEFAKHPREMLDIICINSDSTYALKKYVFISAKASNYGREVLKEMKLTEAICTMYLMECEFEALPSRPRNSTGFNLGALLCHVTTYMAYLDSSIRPFADFLNNIDGSGGIGLYDYWNLNNLSSGVIKIIKKQGFNKDDWSKWSEQFGPL